MNYSGLPEAVKGHRKAIEELSGVQAALMIAARDYQREELVLPGVEVR